MIAESAMRTIVTFTLFVACIVLSHTAPVPEGEGLRHKPRLTQVN